MEPVFRMQAGELSIRVAAGGLDPSALALPLEALGLPSTGEISALRLEPDAALRWGSVEGAFLARVLRHLDARGIRLALSGLPPEFEQLLGLARAGTHTSDTAMAERSPFLARIGLRAGNAARELGAFVTLLGETVCLLPPLLLARAKVRGAEVLEVLAESSSRALGIVAVVNLLMGAILAFVGAVQLRRFGAGLYVADLVGIASVRELTPILTGIVLAGRTGASFAARIATMQSNEEVDALVTLGISPSEFLVLPRVITLTLLMPLLYVYGCAFAMLGGLGVSASVLDLSPAAYWGAMRDAIAGANFAIGALKAGVFGALVALLGCHYGLRAERSAAGVGDATTSSVVASIVGIIAIDAVFAVCANALGI